MSGSKREPKSHEGKACSSSDFLMSLANGTGWVEIVEPINDSGRGRAGRELTATPPSAGAEELRTEGSGCARVRGVGQPGQPRGRLLLSSRQEMLNPVRKRRSRRVWERRRGSTVSLGTQQVQE